jgi:propanol-preferring alcohol dehydrogenase
MMATPSSTTMTAMALYAPQKPLVMETRPLPAPGPKEIRLKVEACGVCRTDLHVVDGELAHPNHPIVPGHEIVGRVEAMGAGVNGFQQGQRVGVPWLGHTCGHCPYCASARENLCDDPLFTGYTRDGGYATHAIADAAYCFPLSESADPAMLAPLLCAGLIGWRTLKIAGPAQTIGVYGFGAAAHIIAQVAILQGRRVHAFVRPGDQAAIDFALSLGVATAQDSDAPTPEKLDAGLIFAPVGALVPEALAAVKKGGAVVCGGIHMSDIPAFPYALLWEERRLLSVANLTRDDAREFLALAPTLPLKMHTTPYPLAQANKALADLRAGRVQGAAVLIP